MVINALLNQAILATLYSQLRHTINPMITDTDYIQGDLTPPVIISNQSIFLYSELVAALRNSMCRRLRCVFLLCVSDSDVIH